MRIEKLKGFSLFPMNKTIGNNWFQSLNMIDDQIFEVHDQYYFKRTIYICSYWHHIIRRRK